LPLKIVITGLLIAPCGFLMGMPFPAGLRLLQAWHSPSIRWAWSLNSAASVLGSCGAVYLALHIGFRNTLLTGAALYLVALAALRVGERRTRAS
jgi:sugar phosphate permease